MDGTETEYYVKVIDNLRRQLEADPRDPSEWPDAAKLRLIAASFDAADLEEGIVGETDIQDDLRRIADKLEELNAD